MRAFVLMLGVAACQAGGADKATTEDPTNEPGTTPEPADEPGLVWVDAEGEVVDGVAEIGGQLMWVDADGWWWRIVDYEPWIDPDIGVQAVIAMDAACTDVWLLGEISLWPARVALWCDDVLGTGSPYCARRGSAPTARVDEARIVTNGACGDLSNLGGYAVAQGDVEALPETPTLPWTPPLHPEWR